MEIALSVIGAVVGIAGLIYAIMTNHAKASLERLIRAELRGFAGNIDHIRNSAHGANEHLHYIRKFAANLDQGNFVTEIIARAHVGGNDAASAERMLQNLLNQVLTLQEGMFGTREVTSPVPRMEEAPKSEEGSS